MDVHAFLASHTFAFVVLPILIFASRICDVSFGTVRVILTTRGMKYLAPVIGFFEVLIWLVAIGQIMLHLTNILCYVAYAAGFAAGTFIGIQIENKLAMGVSLIRMVVPCADEALVSHLKEAGIGVTSIDAQGLFHPVKVLFTVVKRKDIKKVVGLIKADSPEAFYTVEDVRFVSPRGFTKIPAECG